MFSLIIPTYNEAKSLPRLLHSVRIQLEHHQIDYEIIVVDDNSPDGTAAIARALAESYPIRVLQRPGKLGLSSAVLDGWEMASGEILGLMDADGSHDEVILPEMIRLLKSQEVEIAIGSRYVKGGSIQNWPLHRLLCSRLAGLMAQILIPVKDTTSGYLVLRKGVIQGVPLDPIGFKIGLEVLVRGRYQNCCEVPYTFRDRTEGQSKFGLAEVWAYLVQLSRLFTFRFKSFLARID